MTQISQIFVVFAVSASITMEHNPVKYDPSGKDHVLHAIVNSYGSAGTVPVTHNFTNGTP